MSTPAPQAGWTARDGGRGRRRASGRHQSGGRAGGAGSAGSGVIRDRDRGRPADSGQELPGGDPGDAGQGGAAGGGGPSGPSRPGPGPEGGSLLRSSSVMAVGTLASRGTGFLRTLMLVFDAAHPRSTSLLPRTHVAVVEHDDLVASLADALARVPSPAPSAVTFVTGPSRSADIEQILTLGVHGPAQVHVVLPV